MSSKKISKVFQVKFVLLPKGKKLKAQVDDGMPFGWFVEHFGKIEVAPRYRITVEVEKNAR